MIIEIVCYTITVLTQLVDAKYLTGMHIQQLVIASQQAINSRIVDVIIYLSYNIRATSSDVIIHLYSFS